MINIINLWVLMHQISFINWQYILLMKKIFMIDRLNRAQKELILNICNYFLIQSIILIMKEEKKQMNQNAIIPKKPFKEQFKKEKRIHMSYDLSIKNPDLVLVVIQKDKSCHYFENLSYPVFQIGKKKNFFEIEREIKKRLILVQGNTIEKQSIFFFHKGKAIHKADLVSLIYQKYQDKEDHILYLTYSHQQAFG